MFPSLKGGESGMHSVVYNPQQNNEDASDCKYYFESSGDHQY